MQEFMEELKDYYILTPSLTGVMERSSSWEDNRFLGSQEITRILWKPKFITAFTIARHLSLSWDC